MVCLGGVGLDGQGVSPTVHSRRRSCWQARKSRDVPDGRESAAPAAADPVRFDL